MTNPDIPGTVEEMAQLRGAELEHVAQAYAGELYGAHTKRGAALYAALLREVRELRAENIRLENETRGYTSLDRLAHEAVALYLQECVERLTPEDRATARERVLDYLRQKDHDDEVDEGPDTGLRGPSGARR